MSDCPKTTDRAADLCRRLDEAAAFMEQGKAVFVPVLLLSAKVEIGKLCGALHDIATQSTDPTAAEVAQEALDGRR
jgi:hypothetical protein